MLIENDPIVIPLLAVLFIGFIGSQPTPGDIPNDAPQPGQPGGGGIPTPGNPALALIPAGLEAVSVFPPWISPRTVPAFGAIFKELPGKDITVSEHQSHTPSREKRHFLYFNHLSK